MKKIPAILSGLALAIGLLTTASVSFGKPEYTKKEKKSCTTCHVKMKEKDLNDVGKCYHEKKDLSACVK